MIDGSIGENSPFHITFGYYAHGVAPETAILPANWKSLVRLENANTNGIAGLCISAADLAISKLAAGREKDLAFVQALFRHKLLHQREVESLFPELDPQIAERIKPRLERCSSASCLSHLKFDSPPAVLHPAKFENSSLPPCCRAITYPARKE